mmetsp:Transcript_2633/g.4510  ORF Transcript_2633/g.4510 Transcript_2633/m.4510 type:complete len:389 (+) Transcript_2633:70-1236(+)
MQNWGRGVQVTVLVLFLSVLYLVCVGGIQPLGKARAGKGSELSLSTHCATLSDAAQTCNIEPCSPCHANTDSSSCKWKFRRYIPSELEARWWQVVEEVKMQPCVAMNERFSSYLEIYNAAIEAGWLSNYAVVPEGLCDCAKSMEPKSFDDSVFSRFEYENECTHELKTSYIEPLAGILRHPRVCVPADEKPFLSRKDWLLVDQWELQKNRKHDSRFLYFDAGASFWLDGAGGSGSSQAWFDSIFVNLCAPFQGYWLWEAAPLKAAFVLGQVPARAKPNYHWYNIPASQDKTSSDSPLFHVRNTARLDDYVVFKIDIDNNPVEEAILYSLLDDPQLLSLIDEFYWEHHVNMYPMTKYWRETADPNKDQGDSIWAFRKMRELGIRAHSWV